MSKSIKTFSMLGLLALVAACGGRNSDVEEFVVVDPVPVTVEPVYTGKYN
ncbi:hypothetical protein [Octadecabacter sp. SW4]|nr:hypothetical protein [Octadecabacter sp. SW4]